MIKKGIVHHRHLIPLCLVVFAPLPYAYGESLVVDISAIEQRLQWLQTQDGSVFFDQPIARLDNELADVPLSVDTDDLLAQALDPELTLPEYRRDLVLPMPQTANDTIIKRQNPIKRLYQRFFGDGVALAPNLDANIYLTKSALDTRQDRDIKPVTSLDDDVLVAITDLDRKQPAQVSAPAIARRADINQEPYKNIKAALENLTTDATPSFSGALPRLTTVVTEAAQAVGYYEVQFRLQNAGGGTINVLIDRVGEPVTVATKAVEVRGQASTLPAFNQVQTSADELLSGVFDHGNYETVKGGILALQGEKGFFDGRFLDDSVEIILPDNTADVSLVYDSGERYQFDEVVFFTTDPTTGEFTTDPAKLPVKLPLLQKLLSFAPNDGYERAKVAKLSNDLLATGYFNNTNVETVLPQGEGVNTASIPTQGTTAVALEGDEAVIAPIDFSPSQALIDKLQAVKTKARRLYQSPDNRVLDESTRRNSSLLGKVSDQIKNIVQWFLPDDEPPSEPPIAPVLAGRKSPVQVATDKKIPLYVYVASDKPKEAQLGAGWGSDTGARLTARVENNLINRDGVQAGAELSVSTMDKGITAFVSRPLSHPLNDKLVANAKYHTQTITQDNNAKLTTKTLESSLTRNLSEGQTNTTYSLRYRKDTLQGGDEIELERLPVFSQGGLNQQAVLVGVGRAKSVQNTQTTPTFGYRHYYSLEAGSGRLGSDTDMVIGRIGASGLLSFGENAYGKNRAHQVVGRFDGGYLWARDFLAVPYRLRFFTGGDQSLRGYNHQSVSPKSPDGYLTGGQVLAVGGIEYSHEVREGLRGAVFADYGGAFDKAMTNKAKLGVGVGVRYASPVGTVRVDIAKGVEQQHTPIRLHFLVGLPF